MALQALMLNEDLRKVEQRISEINSELEALEEQEAGIIERYSALAIDDEAGTQEIYNESETLIQEKALLKEEQEKLLSRKQELEARMKKSIEGEKTTMSIREVKTQEEATDIRSALNDYFHKVRTERADGFISEDGSVLIPEDVIYQPRDEIYTEQDLEQYISTVTVSTPTGKYPVLKRTSEVMHTVEELAENPRLANPKFNEVLWTVDTYRGYIPVSQEAIDDSAVDLTGLIARHILRIVLNTTNKLVAALIKGYQPAIAKSLDDLKKLDDTMLDPAYGRRFYMSRSMYYYLDTLKDSHGDYVLQPDVTSPSGKVLFGIPIVRINDNLIGDYNGQLVCFFGDMPAAITKFSRKEISAQWTDNDHYSNKIMAGFRAGYKSCDEKAGYYVIFAPAERDIVLTTSDEQTPETVEGVEATITVQDNQAIIKYTGLTGQVITYSLKDAKGAIVAEMVGRFTTEKTEDTITVTFAQDMVKGDYTLEAKVLDQKKYKAIKSVKLNIKQQSDEIAKTLGSGVPIVISNH